jgi:hypothetical protein
MKIKIYLINLDKANYPDAIMFSQYNCHKLKEAMDLEEKGYEIEYVKLSPEEFFKK